MGTESVPSAVLFTESAFESLVQAASRAPSPDNNQPWAFRRAGESIEVYHCRDRALPSDVNDIFSWAAIGSALENLVLAASAHGFCASVRYDSRPFPLYRDHERIAVVDLRGGGAPDPLHAAIDARMTNRKPYSKEPIETNVLKQLAEVVVAPQAAVHWLTDRRSLADLARLVGVADRIRFEHQPFHDELHHVLRFGEAEARRAGDGLELRSLEIPAAAGPILRFLRPWRRMRWANRLGMSRVFARTSVVQVHRSGAIGLLTTADRSDRGYLEAWRSTERVWLAATVLGLAFQPLGALPLFLTKLDVQGPAGFAPQHAQRLAGVVEPFYRLFPDANNRGLVMLFRIGKSGAPSARSFRYPIERVIVT